MAHREIERQVFDAIPAISLARGSAAGRVKVLDRLALHDDGIRSLAKDCFDGKLMRHTQVPKRSHESGVTGLALIPPATQRRETGADEDLVDWREVPNPRIPSRKRSRVLGEKNGERDVLKSAEP